ncbi:hypothetical protein WN51_03185 [Melipona quadrifasciata]|uniref:Uncharacterized protein n=1 Tax=Melipona quadrifasciata TaxID=166423 RepID=A0A0M8ZVX8_9HYME|nr:hypothetical protein WN51_03185 [Melipona quadrifasciata]
MKFDQSIVNQSFKVTKKGTMKFNACFLLLWASITLTHAGPTHKTIEKKSLAEDTKVETIKEDLKIEEIGEQKDRSKKAAVCLQINPASPQVALNENFVQNVPLMMQVPQLVPQHVQTLNFVQPAPQSLPQASIVVPQQIIQASQPLSQANIVLPQQMLQPIHNVQIVQPSSEPHSANQIVQPPEELETDPQPEPTSSPKTEIESVTKTPNHVNTEKFSKLLPARQEALTVVPVVPRYQELMFISEHATFVQVPSISACNHFHNQLTKCSCRNIEPVAINMMPFMSYSSPYDARSSLMMPHVHTSDAKDYKTNQVVPGLQEKPRSLISMNIPHYGHRPHYHPTLRGMHYLHPETSLRNKYNLLSSPALIPEVHDLTQTNKSPRETDSSQLSLEKEGETKQAEGKATLIDGRRNARSNKEEIKEQEKQIIKT